MTGGGRTGKVIKLECGSTIIIYKRDGLSRQKLSREVQICKKIEAQIRQGSWRT